jgi:DNA-directed RNA polymerase sigma subunit (sigma70/sigma32)
VRALERARDDLIRSLVREPSHEELAHALGASAEDVRVIEALRVRVLSLERATSLTEEPERQAVWEIPDAAHRSPEAELTRKGLAADLEDCLATALTEDERRVLTLRYPAQLTLEQVARVLGVPLGTVGSRERRAERKMKACLEGKGWEVREILHTLS